MSDGLTVVEQALDALSQAAPSASSLLPNTGPATFQGNLTVTDALYAGSLETGHALLTPRIVAPAPGDLAIRSYGNMGRLSTLNATGSVSIADRLLFGGGSLSEHNNGSFRVLNLVHDVGVNIAVSSSSVPASSEVVLSLDATTGATVTSLSASGNCTVSGQLVVSGRTFWMRSLPLRQQRQSASQT